MVQKEWIEMVAKKVNTLNSDLSTTRANSEALSMENGRIATEMTKATEELARVKSELSQIKSKPSAGDEAHKVEMDCFRAHVMSFQGSFCTPPSTNLRTQRLLVIT